MIYKCKNCDASLIYSPEDNRLNCRNCESSFLPEEIDYNCIPTMQMEMNIYSCSACGAEVMVNENEAASYCVYCGQPVIVFERVSSEMQPDYIVPFTVPQQDAMNFYRYAVRKNKFVPRSFRKATVEKMRGIYVPFWLYDFDYFDEQHHCVSYKNALGAEQNKGYVRSLHSVFADLPVNASSALSDEELTMLGEYDLRERVPFNPAYLSGLYADKYDVDYNEAFHIAADKAKVIVDHEVEQSIMQTGCEMTLLRYSNPSVKFRKATYIMLPVWFLTLQYKGKPYTVLINGQTGRPAGNLPIHKGKAVILFLLLMLLVAVFTGSIAALDYAAYLHQQNYLTPYIISGAACAIFSVFGIFIGHVSFKAIKKGLSFTRSRKIRKYVKDRQEV